MKQFWKKGSVLSLAVLLILSACRKKDAPLLITSLNLNLMSRALRKQAQVWSLK